MSELFDGYDNELSRREDPETSREAAAEISVSLGDRCRQAYRVLKENQGRTSNEIDRAAGVTDGSMRKRLNDLRKFGFAKNSGYRTCTVTNRRGQLWWLGSRKESELKNIRDGVPDGWDKFWEAYPRKTAKRDALRAYSRLAPNEELQSKILQAIENQKKSIWHGKALEYVPHPATWLNGERWNDDVKLTAKVSAPIRTTEDVVKEMKQRREKFSVAEDELKKSQELLRKWKERRAAQGDPSAPTPIPSDGQVESPI